MFKFHLVTQFHTPSHPKYESDWCVITLERNMSDISNTNGAGDAENVAKVSLFSIELDRIFCLG